MSAIKSEPSAMQQLGDSILLTKVGVLSKKFGIKDTASTHMLRNLRIPIIHIAADSYFNFYALEKAIFFLSRFGGPGYAAPGSSYKNGKRWQAATCRYPPRLEITDEDIATMNTPFFVAEWMATGPRNHKPASIKTYIDALPPVEKSPSTGGFQRSGEDASKTG